jgi:hypothetical protein
MKIIPALLLLCVISAPLQGGYISTVTAAGTTLTSAGPVDWPTLVPGGLEVSGSNVFATSGLPGFTNTTFKCTGTAPCNVAFDFRVLGPIAGWLPETSMC